MKHVIAILMSIVIIQTKNEMHCMKQNSAEKTTVFFWKNKCEKYP